MREDGDHATRFDIVCCEVEISIAYRRHNGIIAMQKTDGAMIGEQCHQLDVGYRMVDSSSERAVDMEKPRTVKPSDLKCGQQIRIVFLRWQFNGTFVFGWAISRNRIEIAYHHIGRHSKSAGVIESTVRRDDE